MTQWYYQDNDSTKIGPLSDEEFRARFEEGAVHAQTRVWRSGLVDWTTYGAVRHHEESAAADETSTVAVIAAPASTEVAAPTEAVRFSTCSECAEQWPEHLLREVEQRRVCGRCIHKEEKKAWSKGLSNTSEVGRGWLWKHLLFCALIGILIASIRMGIGMMRQDAKKAIRQHSAVHGSSSLDRTPR